MNSELIYNEITKELNHVYLKKDSSIYLECAKHKKAKNMISGIELKFKIFSGDSCYFLVEPCPKCIEEAKELGRKEIEKDLWERIIQTIKEWQKGE